MILEVLQETPVYAWMILGLLTAQRLKLRPDQKNRRIEVGGSFVPLALFLMIYLLRYLLIAASTKNPLFFATWVAWSFEGMAAFITGFLCGRFFTIWKRSKSVDPLADN